MNEGCLFWVYLGHGSTRSLDHIHVPGGHYPIMGCQQAAGLRCRSGSPIACFLACYTAAFDQPEDCLAEELLRSPGGPVAVVGGSRVTMPYAMAVMGTEMLDQCFVQHCPTLGEAILRAKRKMVDPADKNQNRVMLDALATLLSPAPADLAAERRRALRPLQSDRRSAVEFATSGDDRHRSRDERPGRRSDGSQRYDSV